MEGQYEGIIKIIKRKLQPVVDRLKNDFRKSSLLMEKKAHNDYVTEADLWVDGYLKGMLNEEFPGAQVWTEESGGSADRENGFFLIDPLDGTINFLKGDPNFAVSIAYVKHGIAVCGLLYSHLYDTVVSFCGDKNDYGNFPVSLSKISELNEASLYANMSHDSGSMKVMAGILSTVAPHVLQVKIEGCSVVDMLSLVSGKGDLYLQKGHKPWDLAVSYRIVQNGGFTVSCLDGSPFDVYKDNCIAASSDLHRQTLEILK